MRDANLDTTGLDHDWEHSNRSGVCRAVRSGPAHRRSSGRRCASASSGPSGPRIDNLLSMLGVGLLTPPAAGPKVSRLRAAPQGATFSGRSSGKSLGPSGPRIDNLLSMLGVGLLTPPAAGPKVSRLRAAPQGATFSGRSSGKSLDSSPQTSPHDVRILGSPDRAGSYKRPAPRGDLCRRGLCPPIRWLRLRRVGCCATISVAFRTAKGLSFAARKRTLPVTYFCPDP